MSRSSPSERVHNRRRGRRADPVVFVRPALLLSCIVCLQSAMVHAAFRSSLRLSPRQPFFGRSEQGPQRAPRSLVSSYGSSDAASSPCDRDRRYARDVSRPLFFRQGEQPGPSAKRWGVPDGAQRRKAPGWAVRELESPTLHVPFDFPLESSDPEKIPPLTACIRCMTPEDVRRVLPMCVDELGPTASVSSRGVAAERSFGETVRQWWDVLAFKSFVSISLRAKMLNNQRQSSSNKLKDPAIIVLTVRESSDKRRITERIVGLGEISLQPVEPLTNPSPIPVPTQVKEMYCIANKLPPLQGWITNVLVEKKERGKGYSKLLVRALEGIARSWQDDSTGVCNAIYLHADADSVSGRIPQSLYEGIGYTAQLNKEGYHPKYSWMSGTGPLLVSKIHLVQGVQLLFYKKDLK